MDKNKVLTVIFCISLSLFLLILSYKMTIHYSGLTPEQKNTMDFLSSDGELKEVLNLNYTSTELSHLQDVRRVMAFADYLFYFLILVTTVILTYCQKDIEQVKTLLKWGGLVTLSAVILILFFSLVSFNVLFSLFHQIFFPQGNWIFPADSLLIQTFPLEFFVKISRNIFIQAFLGGIIFILLSYSFTYLRQLKKTKE